jgi:hypothetical protein
LVIKEKEYLSRLLKNVNNRSNYCWTHSVTLEGNHISKKTEYYYEYLKERYFPISERVLKKMIESETNISLHDEKQKNLSFYLPPLDDQNEFIPILSLDAEYLSNPPKCEIRVGLYKLSKKQNIIGFGIRFECEHRIGKSKHKYYHAQLTKTPIEIINHIELPLIHESIPCIILPAKNHVSLFISTLISMYGKTILGNIDTNGFDDQFIEPFDFFIA